MAFDPERQIRYFPEPESRPLPTLTQVLVILGASAIGWVVFALAGWLVWQGL